MQALLFDMDGVLYNGSVPIPGASQALAWVRQQKIPHLFGLWGGFDRGNTVKR